jgi:hypothetical protein
MFDIKLTTDDSFYGVLSSPPAFQPGKIRNIRHKYVTFVIEMQGRLCDTSFGRSVNFLPDSGLVL